ncbi:unnamed protein product [Lupinus luteus]|uniref:Uncharacterized protein n=1 Tax=Lupinus luteus TaxID=3873 RepID=A0AAV1WWZ8_LUPLU
MLDSWLFYFLMKSKGGEKLGECIFCQFYSRHLTPKERGSIQDRGSILKTSQDISPSMLLSEISENYIVKKILVCHHQKGGDCEEDLAPDLGTVLMKTPTSPKRRKGR